MGLKLFTIIELIVGIVITTGSGAVGATIEGTENDVSTGSVGVIVPTVGLPGVTGVTSGMEGFVTPRDIGCLSGSFTCIPTPRSISFGCCND